MALETIDLYGRIVVATTAEMTRTLDADRFRFRPRYGVTGDAFLKAELLGPDAAARGFVALVR